MMSAALTLVAVVLWVAMEEFETSGLQVENESEVGSRVWLFELIGVVCMQCESKYRGREKP